MDKIICPKSYGLPELDFVKLIATQYGISLQKALTMIRKNSIQAGK